MNGAIFYSVAAWGLAIVCAMGAVWLVQGLFMVFGK